MKPAWQPPTTVGDAAFSSAVNLASPPKKKKKNGEHLSNIIKPCRCWIMANGNILYSNYYLPEGPMFFFFFLNWKSATKTTGKVKTKLREIWWIFIITNKKRGRKISENIIRMNSNCNPINYVINAKIYTSMSFFYLPNKRKR